MFTKAILTTLALAASTLAGQAIVKNNCSAPIYITSVDSTIGDTVAVSPSGLWSEPEHYDPATGIAIKIGTTDDALYTSKPILHLSYTLNTTEGSIYYDLSTAYGYDSLFQGNKLWVHGDEGKSAPEISWENGPEPQDTKAFFEDTDLILELCV